jgi:SMI1-KNR4 cell-wall
MIIEFLGLPFCITNPPLNPVSLQELSSVEERLGFMFPDDYRSFITTFGSGEINIGIRADSPMYILNDSLPQMQDTAKNLVWNEKSSPLLDQSIACEYVPFFNSYFGDLIVFHPSDLNSWLILPHEFELEDTFLVRSFHELYDYYAEKSKDDIDEENEPLQPPYKFTSYSN